MAQATAATASIRQPSFAGFCPVTDAINELSLAGAEPRGAVFTRREVVEFVLDLAGYRSERPLHKLRILEPAFGGGDFLIPTVERLLKSWSSSSAANHDPVSSLGECIRAVEIHRDSYETTREAVTSLLIREGIGKSSAASLVKQWLVLGDFLLVDLPGEFDMVVGNPPYVRQELIPDALLSEYRARYTTIYDRADLYIPFLERSLRSLTKAGALAFICADRWTKNRYGEKLRQLVSEEFHLRSYVDMVDTPAFHSEVIAYPAIMVIGRERGSETRVAFRPEINRNVLVELAVALTDFDRLSASNMVRACHGIVRGSEPWIFDALEGVSLVRRLEAQFPTLEEAGCKVGIGVATGADKAFIGPFSELDVEEDRKLPLVMTRDIIAGAVEWQGRGVINPFKDNGELVDLAEYPRLQRYLESRKDEISGRHVAKRAPANWYRTIDRITPQLAITPKLLVPDIKGDAHVVYEEGKLYPHHNLYYITSTEWGLKALQAVLMSGIARLFVATYSTKMHGGFLRFQAQYLRRIRIPRWADIPVKLRKALCDAAEKGNAKECDRAVAELYGLSENERQLLRPNAAANGN